jgi:hypothetical protein
MSPIAKEYQERIREAFLDGDDALVYSLYTELNTSKNWDVMLEVWSVFPASMRRQLKEIAENYDPTPWCIQCGARVKEDCGCPPIADND